MALFLGGFMLHRVVFVARAVCCAVLLLCGLAACQPAQPKQEGEAVELTQGLWALVSLRQQPAKVYDDQPEVHLVFIQEEAGLRIAGSDGCNRLIGMAQLKGANIDFGQMGTTMMACPKGQEQGQEFLRVLAQTHSLQVEGKILRLLNKGKELAVFENRAL
jgi:heat shock protein HslJ